MKTLILIMTILLGANAFAGDGSHFESLGFSKSGLYYAYTQEGEHDGSGAYCLELGIIEVYSNRYVARETMGGELTSGEVTTPDQKPEFLRKLKKKLNFKNYFPSRPTQKTVLQKLPTDYSTQTDARFSTWYQPSGGANTTPQTYQILLTEVEAPITPDNDWCYDWYGNKMIEVRLMKEDVYGQGQSKIDDLQIDKHQPKVRACSSNYRVEAVNVLGESALAVAIRFATPGFEGPNERVMIVTGSLN